MLFNKQLIGSYTAKGGFENELDVCVKLLNYKSDLEAQQWLYYMGYDYTKIQSLRAIQIPPTLSKKRAAELGITNDKFDETKRFKKADIQLRVEILLDNVLMTENLSLKKANKSSGFNQIDKRPVSTYQDI